MEVGPVFKPERAVWRKHSYSPRPHVPETRSARWRLPRPDRRRFLGRRRGAPALCRSCGRQPSVDTIVDAARTVRAPQPLRNSPARRSAPSRKQARPDSPEFLAVRAGRAGPLWALEELARTTGLARRNLRGFLAVSPHFSQTFVGDVVAHALCVPRRHSWRRSASERCVAARRSVGKSQSSLDTARVGACATSSGGL